MLDVSLIGTSGMMPLPNRYLTALYLRLNGRLLLIDCGEGTQVTLKSLGWGFKNLDVILITHFHADHISGLPGLLLTVGNSGREEPITIIGPRGLSHVVKSLLVIAPELPFEINIIEMQKPEEFQIGEFNIKSLNVEHGMDCFAYSIYVKRLGKFNPEKAKALNLPVKFWSVLQKGETVEYEGKTYEPDLVMGDCRKGIKISYCTDSRPVKRLVPFIAHSDLFICEGIYGEDEKIDKAREYKHMIFKEAATLAKDGEVKELWLTHYSPALTNPKEFLNNARAVFKNSYCGYDRKCVTIMFEE
ncbi:MAG: ribonuclease Z [Defluviitaleaceae bacterium]|nr:ribonuclease Z [Defluviitaleaceae bacterium]